VTGRIGLLQLALLDGVTLRVEEQELELGPCTNSILKAVGSAMPTPVSPSASTRTYCPTAKIARAPRSIGRSETT
jgi:hypothetical protein